MTKTDLDPSDNERKNNKIKWKGNCESTSYRMHVKRNRLEECSLRMEQNIPRGQQELGRSKEFEALQLFRAKH